MKVAVFVVTILILGLTVSGQTPATVVEARAGDNVQKLAERHGADPLEVAVKNGLLKSTQLREGYKITLPSAPCMVGEAPEVGGLRIGMTENEVMDETGLRFEVDLLEPYLRTARRLGLELQTFDDKLYLIRRIYDVNWDSVHEFIENFAPKLGLPSEGWKIGPLKYDARLTCQGFDVHLVASGSYSSLSIWDTTVPKEVERLKREIEENKKRAIKP